MATLHATDRWFSGGTDADGHLTSAGRQPVTHAGCEVLFTGFVANRDELRMRFGAAAGVSEEALVAEAFRRWGRELDRHVIGEYAAVVADPRAREVLLTHDSFGLRTLFHSRRDGRIRFSTRLADLVDEATASQLDEEYLADFVALGRHTNERTPYRGVERLLPGQALWVCDGRVRRVGGWRLARLEPLRLRTQGEYDEMFRALLTEAVRAALPGDGVVWTDLSGGLDSSSVTSVAALLDAPGHGAYSVVSPGLGGDADEERWMRAVVDHYELPWHRLDIGTALPFSRLPAGFVGEPSSVVIEGAQVDAKARMTAEHGVTAILTGYGGDVVLGQCSTRPPHLADPLFEGRPLAALRGVRDWKRGAPEPRSYAFWALRGLAEPAVDHLLRRGRVRPSQLPPQPWIAPDYLARMRVRERAVATLAPRCRRPGRQLVSDRIWASSLAMSGVSREDRSYELRNPLMDRRLVEFMQAIPWDQSLRPGRDRWLQRRALTGILPELVRNRTTKGTGSRALIEGLRRSRDWPEYLTDECLMAEHGIADAELWRLAVRQAAVGQTNGDQFFEAGVAIEVWLKQLRKHRAS